MTMGIYCNEAKGNRIHFLEYFQIIVEKYAKEVKMIYEVTNISFNYV